MVTKENALQFKEVCQWIADGECQYLDREKWIDISPGEQIYFSCESDRFRRKPRKVTRPMTVEEVIAIGYFTRKHNNAGGLYRYTTGMSFCEQTAIDSWVKCGDTYTTDGGKSWHPFTVE